MTPESLHLDLKVCRAEYKKSFENPFGQMVAKPWFDKTLKHQPLAPWVRTMMGCGPRMFVPTIAMAVYGYNDQMSTVVGNPWDDPVIRSLLEASFDSSVYLDCMVGGPSLPWDFIHDHTEPEEDMSLMLEAFWQPVEGEGFQADPIMAALALRITLNMFRLAYDV